MIKKVLFVLFSVMVMALAVVPAQCAEWEYAYVTFTGYNEDVGEVPFGLFIEFQTTGTSVNMQGTLLAKEDFQPVGLTGGGDLETDGSIKSFNLTGTSSGALRYATYDFDFNVVTSESKVTIVSYVQSISGGWDKSTYVFHGTWDFRFCLNS